MATAIFTTVEARVDQTLTNAIWADEIKDNINQLAGAHKSLLVNGGFEVWQRGAGAFTVAGTYTADRWQISESTASITVTKETTTKATNSVASLKAVATVGGATYGIEQKIEDVTQLRGVEVTFALLVQQSVASGARLDLTDSAGTTSGAAVATTGSFVLLTVTRTINSAATTLSVFVRFTSAGTFYLDNAMLVIGPAPAPYRPLHPQEDLARCQRYYEVHGGLNDEWPIGGGYAAAGAVDRWVSLLFAVPKGGLPTVTKNGTWGVVNCAQPTASAVTTAGYSLKAVSTALGEVAYFPNSTDDTITAEWNP